MKDHRRLGHESQPKPVDFSQKNLFLIQINQWLKKEYRHRLAQRR